MFTKICNFLRADLISSSHNNNLFCILIAAVLCYINSIWCGYAYDDGAAILENKDVQPSTPLVNVLLNDFWGTPLTEEKSHGSYRPLCVLTFRLNCYFTDLEPFYFHCVNVILHAVASTLSYWCAIFLSFSEQAALYTALLYAVHPIHTDAVPSVVGRAELLAATFFFSAIICYSQSTRSRGFTKACLLFAALACVPLAALSKEAGITVVGVIIIYEILTSHMKVNVGWNLQLVSDVGSVVRLAAVAVTLFAFMIFRLRMMPNMPRFSHYENPASKSETPFRQLTFAYLLPLNAFLLLYPWPLCNDWHESAVPLIESWADPRNVLTLTFFIALILSLVILYSRRPFDYEFAMCLVLIAIPFLPASNLLFYVGFMIAERILYIPSFGWCALVAVGYNRMLKRFQNREANGQVKLRCLQALMLLLIVSFSCRTIVRNLDWVDNRTLFGSCIRHKEHHSKLYAAVGGWFNSESKFDEGFAYQYKALKVQPKKYNRLQRTVASTLMALKQPEWAEKLLRNFIGPLEHPGQNKSIDDQLIDGSLDLIRILSMKPRTDEQLEDLDKLYFFLIGVEKYLLTMYHRRGEIYYHWKNYDTAWQLFEHPVRFYHDCAACFYNMAIVNLARAPKEDNWEVMKSLELLETCISYDPEHYHAMHAFALIVQEIHLEEFYGRAVECIREVIDYENSVTKCIPRHVGNSLTVSENFTRTWDSYYIAARLEMEMGNFDETCYWFSGTVKRSPASHSFLPQLSWMIHVAERNQTVKNIEQIFKDHSDTMESWLLLGYYHSLKTRDFATARQAFFKALEFNQLERDMFVQEARGAAIQLEICRLLKEEVGSRYAFSCLADLLDGFSNNFLITHVMPPEETPLMF